MDSFIVLFVALPLAAAFIIPVIGRFTNVLNDKIASAVLLFLAGLAVYFAFWVEGQFVYAVGGWQPVYGVPIAIYLVLDGLSTYLLLIINIIAFVSAFYSISYMKRYTDENNYYTLFCLMVAGMNGVVLSGDIFNLFVFLEIAAVASYALVAFGTEKPELEATFKYQVLGGMASIFILLGIGLLYWITGTVNIADISRVLMHNTTPAVVFIQILFISSFGLKAAMIPFHAWLPDAHPSAPSPISAMLSGVLIKAVGVYVIFRLFFNMFIITYEIALIITVIGSLSMAVGVVLAIGQWDVKRLLAYHSISQMGYVVLGVGVGMLVLARGGDRSIAALAIGGGLFHLFNHAVFKGLLFLNAGAVEYETGTRSLKRLGGLYEKMPVTYSTTLSSSMAISGIPPFNGFFSKLIIIIATVKAGYYLISFLAVLVSIVTLASFLKVLRYTFFTRPEPAGNREIREVPFTMCFSMVVLAVLCLTLSLLVVPDIRDIVLTPAVDVLLNTLDYSKTIVGY